MYLASDYSARIDYLKALLDITLWDIAAGPLPADMRDILLAMDVDQVEADMREALALRVTKPRHLRLV